MLKAYQGSSCKGADEKMYWMLKELILLWRLIFDKIIHIDFQLG